MKGSGLFVLLIILAFTHPGAAIALTLILILIMICIRASERSPNEMPPDPQIAYRREVTVRETVYVAPSYRPRVLWQREPLEGIFRPLDE